MTFNVDDLISQGLVNVKSYTNGLKVLKYDKSVFYKNLWCLDNRLKDCRGTVIDKNKNLVSYPFTKVFNYGENNTFVDRDKYVLAVRKINGFMAAVSWFNDDILVSTTGTLHSDYAMMAKHSLLQCSGFNKFKLGLKDTNKTFVFEIVHENDPHIVKEDIGVYLIGLRDNKIGSELAKESVLDKFARRYGFKRPEYKEFRFSDLVKHLKNVEHEGFMVRDLESGKTLCKLKSPYYNTKKFFMRTAEKKLRLIFENKNQLMKQLDEEYYPLLDYITSSFDKETWKAYNEQERRLIIEDYLNG